MGDDGYTDADAWRENYEGMAARWAECNTERLRLKDELASAEMRLRVLGQQLDLEPGEYVVGRVSVYRVLQSDGEMRDEVRTDDGNGDEVDLPTAVGMLAIAQHTLLCGEGER